MTGHGQALVQDDAAQVMAEVRSVNNRFLKLNIIGDLDSAQLSELETLVKQFLNRGSVNLRLKVEFMDGANNFRLNETALRAYARQLREIMGTDQPIDLHALLQLPGVVEESSSINESSAVWPLIQNATRQALENLSEMRQQEGQFMAHDLAVNCDIVEQKANQIAILAPRVIENYSRKMTDRINQMLSKFEASIEAPEVIREVGIFAERVDISEEIVRLNSHVGQFRGILAGETSDGRKLDFLTQEMLRETNTIGSKANDAEIASHVIEIKTAIERIREMVQNVE
jgi:uncharacterized protein (TIGR00255 family)